MNWFKWLACYWHGRHFFCSFRRADGTPARRCIRCGCER